MRQLAACTALFALIASTALAAPTQSQTGSGPVLVGDTGMTLYIFKKDKPGSSSCVDKCASNWPPYLAAEGTKADAPFSIIERPDDTYQWAKNGMPLYYWTKDRKPGDTGGEGINGVWSVARP